MARLILLCLLSCGIFTNLNAALCTPTILWYEAYDYYILVNWSYEDGDDCSPGNVVILSELGVEVLYEYDGDGAMINVPYACNTYKFGFMPYSEGGTIGPVEYVDIKMGTPSDVYVGYLSIKANDTYIIADWNPDVVTQYCYDKYWVSLSLTDYSSPLDTESLHQMTSLHYETATTYDIMPLNKCVNNTITVIVAPYYNGIAGKALTDTYICN